MLQQIAADKDRSVEEASASTLVGDGLPLRRIEDPRPWETRSSRIEAWHPQGKGENRRSESTRLF